MGFVDDLELQVDPTARVIHVRSASRLGHRDFGVNRARVESLRAAFAAGSLMNPLESWTEEQRSAYLYRACADAEAGTRARRALRRLAGEAEAQAAIWRAQLTAQGHPAPAPFVPDTRAQIRRVAGRGGSVRAGCAACSPR